MKKPVKIILITSSLILSFLVSCSKDNDPAEPTIGDLYNKPLSVIKASIEGRWQLHYGKGGIASNMIHDWGNDDYWEFDFSGSTDHIKAYDDPITADATITWIKGQDAYVGSESYTMSFFDNLGDYTVLGVYNDTLVIKDSGSSEPIFYYFTKP